MADLPTNEFLPDDGADERIDPFETLTPYSVDHLARYALASQAAQGKRILDAATGAGFGAWLLASAGAAHIDAVDLDVSALKGAAEHYSHEAISYQPADLDTFEGMPGGPWDLVTCFETLEHIADPEAFLHRLKPQLAPGALLFLSVPGEADETTHNPFHLHHFDRASFAALVQRVFPDKPCTLLTQRLSVAAEFRIEAADGAGQSEALPLAPNAGNPPIDGYLAIVGAADIAAFSATRLWHSTAVWSTLMDEREHLYAECRQFADKYRALFAEHSELQEKFSTCLAWGTYNYEQNNGKGPDPDFLEPLREETFGRSHALEQELATAQKRIAELEAALAQLQAHQPGETADKRKRSIATFLQDWRKRAEH